MLRRHNAWLATSALSLLTIGCSTAKNEPAPAGATQALPRSSVPMTYYVDMVGPVVNPLSKPSIGVPSKETARLRVGCR